MSNISASSDYKQMKYHLLKSSYQDAFNGSIYMSLASIDKMLFAFFCLATFQNISLSIGLKVT